MAPPRVLVGISICLSLNMCSRLCDCLIRCIILLLFCFHALLTWFVCCRVGCICLFWCCLLWGGSLLVAWSEGTLEGVTSCVFWACGCRCFCDTRLWFVA